MPLMLDTSQAGSSRSGLVAALSLPPHSHALTAICHLQPKKMVQEGRESECEREGNRRVGRASSMNLDLELAGGLRALVWLVICLSP